jgi:hypothetical protein
MTDNLIASQAHGASGSTTSDAHASLRAWHLNRADLSFVYTRSKGGLIVTGRATISALDERFLRLHATASNLLVTVLGAIYSTEPQRFFAFGFQSSSLIDGISLQLENYDWLFLSVSALPGNLSFARIQIPSRG